MADIATTDYDVIVVGCGGAGSACAYWLARRGTRVLAIDRFGSGHSRGSSHGRERIMRLAYAEPLYVDFALQSLPLWRELEQVSGTELLRAVGGIDTGTDAELAMIAAGCAGLDVRFEWLEPAEAARRFPGLRFVGPAIFQADAACIDAEAALRVFADGSIAHGGVIHRDECVTAIEQDGDGVQVVTVRGTYRASSVVVTTGAWAHASLERLFAIPEIAVTQEQVGFFEPVGSAEFPTFIDRQELSYYGLPTPDGLVKIAEHHTGPIVDPETRDGVLEPHSWERLKDWVAHNVPGVRPSPVDFATCLYASAPEEDFVIDRVGRVTIGVGLGGHGFKFLPLIGQRLGELATGIPWNDNPFALAQPPRQRLPTTHR